MAFDTVVDKEFLESGLKTVADAIREVGETQEVLPFPDGFATQIRRMCAVKDDLLQGKKDELKSVIERTVTNIYNEDIVRVAPYSFMRCGVLASAAFPNAASVGESGFQECPKLTAVNLPSAAIIGVNAFNKCYALSDLSLPKATEIRAGAFRDCSGLAKAALPAVETIGEYAFAGCSQMTELDLPKATSIANHAFRKASGLETLILRSNTMVTLKNVGAFYGVNYCTVYVPKAILTQYTSASGWADLIEETIIGVEPIEGSKYENGESENLISFTISGTTYQAEEGMTWGEWCESEYNTSADTYRWSVDTDFQNRITNEESQEVGYEDYSNVYSDDVIQEMDYKLLEP